MTADTQPQEIDRPLDRLRSFLASDGVTELGFAGFNHQNVVDIGSGDGRYSQLTLDLGAKSLLCIENCPAEINRMNLLGNCATASVLLGDATTAWKRSELVNGFGIATVFNIAPHKSEPLLTAARELVGEGGDVVVTSTEVGLLSRIREIEEILRTGFKQVGTKKLWNGQPMMANNFVTVATNKRS